MKLTAHFFFITAGLSMLLTPGLTQPTGVQFAANPARVAFTLKNSLGHHRMFRVEGPGIAYGFTMNRNERVPQNWPVGAKLYFSTDGETVDSHILTVTADDGGKTLTTGERDPGPKTTGRLVDRSAVATPRGIAVRFRNNSFRARRVALITYKPGETGNGTSIFTMMPFTTTKAEYAVGTRVYFADDKQVAIVMSGKSLTDKPFLVVSETDAGKTFTLFR